MRDTNVSTAVMNAGGFQYRIIGDDLQMLEIRLGPGEEIIGEAGAMMYMEPGIEFESKMGKRPGGGGGMLGGLMNAGARMLAGESIFVTHFRNAAREGQIVAFSSEAPGQDRVDRPGRIRRHGACTTRRVSLRFVGYGDHGCIFKRTLARGFFGGEGFILQKVQGRGHIFMSAGGTIVERELKGERLRVDSGCIVAFQEGINYDIHAREI